MTDIREKLDDFLDEFPKLSDNTCEATGKKLYGKSSNIRMLSQGEIEVSTVYLTVFYEDVWKKGDVYSEKDVVPKLPNKTALLKCDVPNVGKNFVLKNPEVIEFKN